MKHLPKILSCFFCLGLSSVYAQGTCNVSQLKASAPNSRYQVQANTAQVKDLQTNLIWQRCAVGKVWSGFECTGTEKSVSWQQALQEAKTQTGWRLPNIKELKSLVEVACYDAAINNTIFAGMTISASFWSSTTVAEDATNAWQLKFDDGKSQFVAKTDEASLILVRNP